MNRKTQEMLFDNSVDMDEINKAATEMIESIKDAGNPKRLNVEVRNENEFDNSLTTEEIFNQIDSEYQKRTSAYDLIRITKVNDCYLVIGVKL